MEEKKYYRNIEVGSPYFNIFADLPISIVPDKTKFIEATKAEFDAYTIGYHFKEESDTPQKLAAYIIRCEEYMNQHLDGVSADGLKTFIDTNGKIDTAKLSETIKANQDKINSMTLLCEAYIAWLVAIDEATPASIDTLPETDPTKLNFIIDELWKSEHDKERKALIAKLNSTEAEFAIVDKYSNVAQGDEPEIK